MIRYTLKCSEGHTFESWFQSGSAFDALRDGGHLSCTVCGGSEVEKALMAPKVGTRSDDEAPAPVPAAPLSEPATPVEAAMRKMRAFIDKNSTDVGRDFAREARAIHTGDAPQRLIHGVANGQEAKALIEDGVPVTPLPVKPTAKVN